MLASFTTQEKGTRQEEDDDYYSSRSILFRAIHACSRIGHGPAVAASTEAQGGSAPQRLYRHEGTMKVEQLAVFLEDGSERLAEVTAILAENGISIRALSLADTAAFAILRVIVNDTEKAKKILEERGFTVGKNEVLVIEVPDKPGGLASVLDSIKANNLHLEYMYAFVHKTGDSGLIIFRFSEPDQAMVVLQKDGIRVLSGEEVYAI